MYFNYYVPDLVVLASISSFILCLFIATLNLDSINNIGIGYYNTLKVSYNKNGWFVKFFESPFRVTLNVASITNHPGWKAGLSMFSLLLSFIFLATLFFLIYVNAAMLWYSMLLPLLMKILTGIVIVIVIIVVIMVISK